jgi:hypothetical protein
VTLASHALADWKLMKLIYWLHHARWDVNNFEWTSMEVGVLSQSISRKKT